MCKIFATDPQLIGQKRAAEPSPLAKRPNTSRSPTPEDEAENCEYQLEALLSFSAPVVSHPAPLPALRPLQQQLLSAVLRPAVSAPTQSQSLDQEVPVSPPEAEQSEEEDNDESNGSDFSDGSDYEFEDEDDWDSDDELGTEDFDCFSNAQLVEQLNNLSLPTNGTRSSLLERLTTFMQTSTLGVEEVKMKRLRVLEAACAAREKENRQLMENVQLLSSSVVRLAQLMAFRGALDARDSHLL